MNKVAIVTGGTSGIGRFTAESLASFGWKVYTISRRQSPEGNAAMHISADVADETAVRRAVTEVLMREARIDLLVNCAGFGISGAIEFTELSEAKRQMEVNFFGMVNVTAAVLPTMRAQRSGRIVNISSVAAPVAIPFQAFYSCSKAAINDYTLALANEVRPFGITVAAVMPGDIRTGFTDARKKSAAGDEAYGGRISRSVAVMEHDEKSGMSPERVGRRIAKIACKSSHKPLYTIGFSYQLVCAAVKLLPARLSNYLVGKIYAK